MSNVERAEFANGLGVDLCVRVHCNGVRWQLRLVRFLRTGTVTLVPGSAYLHDSLVIRSRVAAEQIHQAVVKSARLPDLGLIERNDIAGFNWSSVPVCLVELGYLTHPKDEQLLVARDGQELFSCGLANGVAAALRLL
jgi:N-acetylmuramoyl-L-alanine amidase